jgi:hypothetical protein
MAQARRQAFSIPLQAGILASPDDILIIVIMPLPRATSPSSRELTISNRRTIAGPSRAWLRLSRSDFLQDAQARPSIASK